VVVADNRFDDTKEPGADARTPTQAKYYDFYQYGGIIRAVNLHILPPAAEAEVDEPASACAAAFIQRVEVFPLSDTGSSTPNGKVRINMVLGSTGADENTAAAATTCTFSAFWDGAAQPATTFTCVLDRFQPASVTLSVASPKPWTPDTPNLHTLKIALMKSSSSGAGIQDSVESRFGLRIVGVSKSGRAITINGVDTKLKGFNRHDMYPQYGPSIPVSIYNSDLALLKVTAVYSQQVSRHVFSYLRFRL
jgi:beta-glucuronidase